MVRCLIENGADVNAKQRDRVSLKKKKNETLSFVEFFNYSVNKKHQLKVKTEKKVFKFFSFLISGFALQFLTVTVLLPQLIT